MNGFVRYSGVSVSYQIEWMGDLKRQFYVLEGTGPNV